MSSTSSLWRGAGSGGSPILPKARNNRSWHAARIMNPASMCGNHGGDVRGVHFVQETVCDGSVQEFEWLWWSGDGSPRRACPAWSLHARAGTKFRIESSPGRVQPAPPTLPVISETPPPTLAPRRRSLGSYDGRGRHPDLSLGLDNTPFAGLLRESLPVACKK